METYYINYADWPPNLKALAHPRADGGQPLVQPAALLDPWGKPYRYDPAGKHHAGTKPDLWTVTPRKKVLGNWAQEPPAGPAGKK